VWCRLTRNGYRAVASAVVLDEAISEALQQEVHHVGSRVDVRAPYAAWAYAQAMLHDRTFGPRGGRRHHTARDFTALRTITKELNYIDTHPALKGVGMLEWQPFWIPVWATGLPERPYRAYPLRDRPFVILTPRWEKMGDGTKVTIWTAETTGPSGDELAEESTHLRLWRQRCA
jgi:hypothetical protein